MTHRTHNHSMRQAPTPRTEARMLFVGIAALLLYLVVLAGCALFSADAAIDLLGIAAANLLLGRAASMSLSYAVGLGDLEAVLLNMLIESAQVLLFYPLFIMSLTNLHSLGWLRRVTAKTSAAAQRHHDLVRRYGSAGLMVFVWSPFSMTGPLVGCVIGHMIGMRPWVIIATVLPGAYMAVICWGLLLRNVFEETAAWGTYAPVALAGAIIVALVLLRIVHTLRGKATPAQRKRR